jgi:hypothetical protein
MKKMIIFLIGFSLCILYAANLVTPVNAQEDLIQTYAPIFYFEKDENCFPVDVSYHISNSYLYQIGSQTPIDQSPTETSISNYTTANYYLDNGKGTVEDNGIISDYQSQHPEFTVYAHQIDSGSTTIVQYWMFYAFNQGTLNQHEGDWEMVQIVLTSGTPTQVMYSQHHSGQKAQWNQVEKEGTHFKVYVARGSHANYLRSYSGVVGIASDIVGANGRTLTPTDYTLQELEAQPWLNYGGLWGWGGATEEEHDEASLLGQTGPPGPKYREDGAMWAGTAWGQSLIAADNNVFLLELILYNFTAIFIVISLLIILLILYRIYKRKKTTGLGPRYLSLLYIDGINTKSIGNLFCIIGIILAIIALFQPWYLMSTNIDVTGYETNGMQEMIRIDGMNGIQIHIPGMNGAVPLGAISLPFSLFIGVSLIFLIIATIGVSQSKKLGKQYLLRGIRLIIPVVIIIAVIILLSAIPFSELAPAGDTTLNIDQVIGAISGAPFGGQQTVALSDVDGQIHLQWGLGSGAILLLLSGILLIIAGVLEKTADIELFKQEKTPVEKKKGQSE